MRTVILANFVSLDGLVAGPDNDVMVLPFDPSFDECNLSCGEACVQGGPSNAKADVLMWLPPQYDDPSYADTEFPVLVVLPGQPSQVQTTFNHFSFGAVAAAEIESGRVEPFVAGARCAGGVPPMTCVS